MGFFYILKLLVPSVQIIYSQVSFLTFAKTSILNIEQDNFTNSRRSISNFDSIEKEKSSHKMDEENITNDKQMEVAPKKKCTINSIYQDLCKRYLSKTNPPLQPKEQLSQHLQEKSLKNDILIFDETIYRLHTKPMHKPLSQDIMFCSNKTYQTMFPRSFTMFSKKICNKSLLNKGTFASVYRISLMDHPNRKYALKVIKGESLKKNYDKHGLLFHQDLYFFDHFSKKPSQYVIKGYVAYFYQNHLYLLYECLDTVFNDVIKKKLTIDKIKTYAQRIFLIIDFLHRNSIVHSDIKPQNMGINKYGEIVIFDFGFSLISDKIEEYPIFKKGGTLAYLSPFRLADPENVTICDDYWAYGVILYQMVERRYPFNWDNIEKYYEESYKTIVKNVFYNIKFTKKNIPQDLHTLVLYLLTPSTYEKNKDQMNITVKSLLYNLTSNTEV